MMKSLLLALAAVPLCVFASDQAPKCDAEGGQACFEAAIEYHRAQAYDKALLCAEKSCMEGHGGGCFYLGFARQQKGEHAQSNPFYEKACSAGYARSACRLEIIIASASVQRFQKRSPAPIISARVISVRSSDARI